MVFQVYHRAYVAQHSPESQTKPHWRTPLQAILSAFKAPTQRASNVVLIKPVDGIHDPWVFRALRMASVVQGGPSGDVSYIPELSSRFVISNDGFDVGGFCDGLPIRKD
jgi:hypothetical protein